VQRSPRGKRGEPQGECRQLRGFDSFIFRSARRPAARIILVSSFSAPDVRHGSHTPA
jgi:hypothetical protein